MAGASNEEKGGKRAQSLRKIKDKETGITGSPHPKLKAQKF